jgi:hypothetical protein
MNRPFRAVPVQSTWRRVAPPLVAYYAITLAVPVANGAARQGAAFFEHAAIVLAVPLVLAVAAFAARELVSDPLRAAGRPRQHEREDVPLRPDRYRRRASDRSAPPTGMHGVGAVLDHRRTLPPRW